MRKPLYQAVSCKQIPPLYRKWAVQQAEDNWVLRCFIEFLLSGDPLSRYEFYRDNIRMGFSAKEAEKVYNKIYVDVYKMYGLVLPRWGWKGYF